MTNADLATRAAASSQRNDRAPARTSDSENKAPTLAQMITNLKPEFEQALPKHVSVDRVMRIAITALRINRALNQCTPASFLGALMTASQLGLEVNTPAGEAYLIPYGDECTLVIGYQGIVKLFWQHPDAKHIDAQAVYENDEFDYAYGLEPFLTHKPARRDRGQIVAYYAVATLKTGGSAFAVLTPEDAKALRGGKVGPDKRFKGGDPMHWMERKTALKQMLKLLPKTVELTVAVAADEQVRTDYTSTLESIQTRPPLEIDGEVVDEATGEVMEPDPVASSCSVCGAPEGGKHDDDLHAQAESESAPAAGTAATGA